MFSRESSPGISLVLINVLYHINTGIKHKAIAGRYHCLSLAALHSVLLARRGFQFACCCVGV